MCGMLRYVHFRNHEEPQHEGDEPLHADVHGLRRHVHDRWPHDGQEQRLRKDGLLYVRSDVRHVRRRVQQVHEHGRVQDVRRDVQVLRRRVQKDVHVKQIVCGRQARLIILFLIAARKRYSDPDTFFLSRLRLPF